MAPGDLGQSMGIPSMTDPRVLKVVDETLARIVASGRVAGGVGGAARAKQYVKMGVRFIGTNWNPWLGAGAAEFMEAVR